MYSITAIVLATPVLSPVPHVATIVLPLSFNSILSLHFAAKIAKLNPAELPDSLILS